MVANAFYIAHAGAGSGGRRLLDDDSSADGLEFLAAALLSRSFRHSFSVASLKLWINLLF